MPTHLFPIVIHCPQASEACAAALVGSVVEANGASSHGALKNLVPCLMEALGSKDWVTRKFTTEALKKLTSVERDLLTALKGECSSLWRLEIAPTTEHDKNRSNDKMEISFFFF
ncbi:microtubule-associated protein TORTIFOLIA isoform X1 [Spatholobus suberectus]|nr:microtubule-associated protein TORTIFOLIA isoform X1 [Spatholobus suberectus]